MTLGQRQHLITIEHKVEERNDVENKPEGWEEYSKAWVSITTTPGSESLESGKQVATDVHVLETHWTPKLAGVTSAMRAVMPDGKRVGIRSATNTNFENRELVLTCVERK